MLTIQHCKESLSRAYVTAVVGRARHKINWNSDYDYGVDGCVRMLEKRGTRHSENRFAFDFQSKTTTDWTLEDGKIVYDLEAKNYNDLIGRAGKGAMPFLLILLCVPANEEIWLDVSADRLILQKCAYWMQLDGVVTSNAATKRIRIPAINILTPNSVETILQKIKSGEMSQ